MAHAHHDGDTPPTSVEDVLALVRARGGRATPARRVLLETLFTTDDHLTADELAQQVHRRSPDVHLTTIYRNLEELEALGVVSHSHLGHGPVTYQLTSHAHAHLICHHCGQRIEPSDELVSALVRRADEESGFLIDPHHLAIFGTCATCRKRGRVNTP